MSAPAGPAGTPPVEAPTAEWMDLAKWQRDPYDAYRRLRESGPVVWAPALGRYMVTSYSGCRAAEADQVTYTADARTALTERSLHGKPMVRKDDPAHAEDRAPINRSLRPKSVREAWAGIFERNARSCLEALVAAGPEQADLDRDFAGPLAAMDLADMLGFTGVRPADMNRWSQAFVGGQGNMADDPAVWERAEAANREVDEVLCELVPHYRAHPDTSLVSAWASSGISLEALHTNVKLVIAGGLNEPMHAVATLVWALTEHPDQRELVLADPQRWTDAFDEAVRLVSPIGAYTRETTRPTTLEGVDLPAGATVMVTVAAGNRDPEVFERPDQFDLERPKVSHLAFGSGVHMCAGHWAARIAVGEIAVPMLYRELPGLRMDVRRPVTWSGFVFRGLRDAPVTWDS